ncbi:MAG TPA: BadF/BadG/BcrA/BcrD ATPase family protein, partial [Streptosporangiaceae bacterium]|nr:BadF/BadG/BcrA/BcrD ATPase family protein [Streptosporangiaceae bacterium]
NVAVGIDAGGSSTRARAVSGGTIVHEGAGGPGNPVMADRQTLHESYRAALAGCPSPRRVAACVSGTTDESKRAQVLDLLARRFPGAVVRVMPDFLGSVMAAPPGTDLCVVAGTGSVVCSRDAAGNCRVTGGSGWVLGDHGSAARLGQAALEYFVADPDRASASLAGAVGQLFGRSDWRTVVRAVHDAPNPAPLLARAAPLLTRAAEDRVRWASELLDDEMSRLAASAASHIEQYLPGRHELQVALSGGVWTSTAARASFITALQRACGRHVAASRSPVDPLDGAVRLAEAREQPAWRAVGD